MVELLSPYCITTREFFNPQYTQLFEFRKHDDQKFRLESMFTRKFAIKPKQVDDAHSESFGRRIEPDSPTADR